MDLTGMHPDDYEAAQKREEERFRLAEGVKSRAKAEKAFLDAQGRVVAAEEGEIRRRKAKAKAIEGLKKKSSTAHEALEYAGECEGLLRAHFIDSTLTTARDNASAVASKAARRLHQAEMDLLSLTRIVERKDPKKVPGVLRDAKGAPIREKPSPSDPSALPPKKHGMVNNPNKWTSRDQRADFMERVRERELAVSECAVAAEAAQKLYAAAETAVSVAYEEALNAG